MMAGAFAQGKPHGQEQAAIPQLNAMARPGGDDLPVIFRTKLLERAGDLNGPVPGDAIIIAAQIKAALVFEAENEMHDAVAVSNGDGIVVGDFSRVGVDVNRVFSLRSGHVGDFCGSRPGFAAISAATNENIHGGPIASSTPRFAISENRAL